MIGPAGLPPRHHHRERAELHGFHRVALALQRAPQLLRPVDAAAFREPQEALEEVVGGDEQSIERRGVERASPGAEDPPGQRRKRQDENRPRPGDAADLRHQRLQVGRRHVGEQRERGDELEAARGEGQGSGVGADAMAPAGSPQHAGREIQPHRAPGDSREAIGEDACAGAEVEDPREGSEPGLFQEAPQGAGVDPLGRAEEIVVHVADRIVEAADRSRE